MTDDLKELLVYAKSVKMNSSDEEKQRRSFAYGNTRIENDRITRKTIKKEAEKLSNKL